jgi:hypothetical protein
MRQWTSQLVGVAFFLTPVIASAQYPVYVYGGGSGFNYNHGLYGGGAYMNSWNQGFSNYQSFHSRESWHSDQGRYNSGTYLPGGARQISGGWNNFDHNLHQWGTRGGTSWGSFGGFQTQYGGGWNNFNGYTGGYAPYGW